MARSKGHRKNLQAAAKIRKKQKARGMGVARPDCPSNKVSYLSEAAADSDINLKSALYNTGFKRSYKCDKCKYWHITRKETWNA